MLPELAVRPQDALLANQTASGMRAVFAPKVDGLARMAERMGPLPLQLVAIFSSVAGLLGSGGQANYAAANAVLDAWSQTSQSKVLFESVYGNRLAKYHLSPA